MRQQANGYKMMALVLLCAFLNACASTGGDTATKTFTPIQDLDAPKWVLKGGAAFNDKAFYARGSATGIKNSSLLTETAEARARSSLADVFGVYTNKLHKDYMEHATQGDMSATSEVQYIERAIKQVSSMTLRGSEIVDLWQNPDSGELFALAKVDLENFKSNLDSYKDLSNSARQAIKEQAELTFQELDKEVQKMQGR